MAGEDMLYAAAGTVALAALTYLMYRSATGREWVEFSKKEKEAWKKGKQ